MARNLVGINPAKRELERTPAQNLMASFLERRGHTKRTPDERNASRAQIDLKRGITRGTKKINDAVAEFNKGAISVNRLRTMIREGTIKEHPLVSDFQMLTGPQQERVMQLAQGWERVLWLQSYTTRQAVDRAKRRVAP